MGFSEWFVNLKTGKVRANDLGGLDFSTRSRANQSAVLDLVLASVVRLLASYVNKCEVQTLHEGKEQKGELYYRLNYSPNPNESKVAFFSRLIEKMVLEGEALVPLTGSGVLLLADGYEVKDEDKAFSPRTYAGVSVGAFKFNRTFRADEVLLFSAGGVQTLKALRDWHGVHSELAEASRRRFVRSTASSGILNVNGMLTGRTNDGQQSAMQSKLAQGFKKIAEGEDNTLILPAGYSFTDLSRHFAESNSRDNKALFEDVVDSVCMALGVPSAFLREPRFETSDVFVNFFSTAIAPILDAIESELNRKLFSREELFAGSCVRFVRGRMKHAELLDATTAIDKAVASGVLTVNEVRHSLGLPKSTDPNCDKHFITKNYQKIEEVESEDG